MKLMSVSVAIARRRGGQRGMREETQTSAAPGNLTAIPPGQTKRCICLCAFAANYDIRVQSGHRLLLHRTSKLYDEIMLFINVFLSCFLFKIDSVLFSILFQTFGIA